MATYASIKYDMDLSSSATGTGPLTLLSTQTASSSATISFTSGIDSTYDEYVFKFYDIHPATANQDFTFNMSIDTGSNYNVTKTTTIFRSSHQEDDSATALEYRTDKDLAQGTGFQYLSGYTSNDNDASCAGTLHLFNPSSTTFVKHFVSKMNTMTGDPGSYNNFVAGYGNTTSAVDAIQFKMASGNIDSGTFKLYGVS